MTGLADNPFTRDILNGVAEQDRFRDPTLIPEPDGWRHDPVPGRVSPPALLQGRRLAVEITDLGALLLPLGSTARLAFDWDRPQYGATFAIRAFAAERTAPGHRSVWQVHPHQAALIATIESHPGSHSVHLIEGTTIEPAGTLIRLAGPDLPLVHPALAHNNSRVPDPATLSGPPEELYLALLDQHGNPLAPVVASASAARGLLVDRELNLTRHEISLSGEAAVVIAIAASDTASARAVVEAIRNDLEPPAQPGLVIETPQPDLTRQLAFAVANTLSARAATEQGDIFVHGRRDRGYADVSHLHQSYAMHVPTLAAGEGQSVRDELTSYLALLDEDGGLHRAPRPRVGSHPYVGTYTNGHLPLALERYLAWTGDRDFLHHSIDGETVISRTRRAMHWIAANTTDGLVAPCGWLDAWNPKVVAQGQTSLVALMGWRALARILDWGGELGSDLALDNAAVIETAILNQLLDPKTGIIAENVLDDGTIEGGGTDDFFAHTQLWAALAGLGSPRALDLVARECWGTGIRVVPESALARPYFADSTDGDEVLALNSTATWLLASWPELTHLFALVNAHGGDPDRALEAVQRQLPTTLHAANPATLPTYYAEKYLHPGDRPWLCTWAGDPSLTEVTLHGIFGIHAGLDSLEIRPAWPATWRGRAAQAHFVLRGERWSVVADPALRRDDLVVDGVALPHGQVNVVAQSHHAVRFGTSW